MKTKALAIVLALCMVISMLPATVFAAAPVSSARGQLSSLDVLEPTALPEAPVETNGKYSVSLTVASGKSHGTAKLYSTSANRGQRVMLLVDPDPGYYAEINYEYSYRYEEASMEYMGKNEYALYVGDGDVDVVVKFKKITEGSNHTVTVNATSGGTVEINQTTAKPGESIIVKVTEDYGYSLTDFYGDVDPDQEVPVYDVSDSEDVLILEFFMPDGDITLNFTFTRNGPYCIDGHLNNRLFNMVPSYSDETATVLVEPYRPYVGDKVTITIIPNIGYRVKYFDYLHGEATQVSENQWTFIMPDHSVAFDAATEAIINPVTVTVDTGLGGTASLDVTEAQEGSTVKVTCVPEEGYRVAQITGVSGITDNGDNTYSFSMPDEAVELHVLFLRHENPFVDVNETHFFYDPVLWAVENGITNGIDATHFGPFQTSNRAAVVTMLWRWAGSPEPTTAENPFEDVPAASWYTKPVLWAVENGITTGVSSTQFGPNLVCNRAQVVTFLYRYLKASAPAGLVNPFADVQAGSWYEAPVLWALANGITTGADATHFNPNGECLRAQFVTFLYRASLLPAAYDLHWVINGFQDTPSEYGTVTLSHERAVAGEVITATVVPAEGYQIDWVKCENGSEITKVSDTEYTFVMPEGEEIFHVNFVEIPTEPTDPEEPTEPVKTYTLDVHTNVNAEITYVDGKTAAAPGESIFFYVIPDPGYALSGVSIFDPYGEIDLSKIQLYTHGDDLYEFVMIDHDIILNFSFE